MSIREQFGGYFKRLKGLDLTGESRSTAKPHNDYMRHKQKKPKTERKKLFKHHILNQEHAYHPEDTNQNINIGNENSTSQQ